MHPVLISLAVFLLASAAAILTGLAHSRRRREPDLELIRERILNHSRKKPQGEKNKPSLIQHGSAGHGPLAARLLETLKLSKTLTRYLEQAGVRWTPARAVQIGLTWFLLGFLAATIILPGSWMIHALEAALCPLAPALHVSRKRKKRLRAFEEQFADSLEFVARAMRTGHSFTAALEMLRREFQEPLAGEFHRVIEKHHLGLPLEPALQNLTGRIPSIDVQFFVSAVLLQRRTGGNLAELLENLGSLIRERFKFRAKIRALSAHGRMTGAVLSVIPVIVGLLMIRINPTYGQFFRDDPIGRGMAAAAVVAQIAGYGVIRKIVSIEI